MMFRESKFGKTKNNQGFLSTTHVLVFSPYKPTLHFRGTAANTISFQSIMCVKRAKMKSHGVFWDLIKNPKIFRQPKSLGLLSWDISRLKILVLSKDVLSASLVV